MKISLFIHSPKPPLSEHRVELDAVIDTFKKEISDINPDMKVQVYYTNLEKIEKKMLQTLDKQ